ncbi:60S acidic ribosomal protein P2-like [Juglans microcarpa x Juglans regia]|uniref:60S acidic ribosomal protein P2-like n=1 Tax=Juglans microcarpa x Juglans regia TaxID=2249226 RepID=UPI001B7DEDBA|nr:60S acidic ribosomal protein P2-like [Juglans microcarpa x Juglans regia]
MLQDPIFSRITCVRPVLLCSDLALLLLFDLSLFSPFSLENMKVIAAYLLALLGGNTSPSAEDIKNILGSVGAEADDDKIELLLSLVKGKDITELIATGREKLAVMSSAHGFAVAATVADGGAVAAAAAAAEPKKELERVEEKEESDEEMCFSLFD